MLKKSILLVAALALGIAQSASADLWQFNISANGTQEVPANASTGTGTAIAVLDTATGIMTVNGTFTGLSGVVSDSHIHGFAAAGVSAGVKIGLSFTGTNSGTVFGSGAITGDSPTFASTLGGLTYLNIHSTVFGGGEIRGQLINPVAIPEPTSAAILGLTGLSVLARRRRK